MIDVYTYNSYLFEIDIYAAIIMTKLFRVEIVRANIFLITMIRESKCIKVQTLTIYKKIDAFKSYAVDW